MKNNDDDYKLCDKLKSLRIEMGFTQEDLAKAIYMSSELIAKYETGEIIPTKEDTEKLAWFLGVKEEELTSNSGKALSVDKSKVIARIINMFFQVIIAISSFLFTVLFFIPIFHERRYVFPIELDEITGMPKLEHYNFSIFSMTFGSGKFFVLILFFLVIITCISAIISIIYQKKEYNPYLNFTTYFFLICDALLFLVVISLSFSIGR